MTLQDYYLPVMIKEILLNQPSDDSGYNHFKNPTFLICRTNLINSSQSD